MAYFVGGGVMARRGKSAARAIVAYHGFVGEHRYVVAALASVVKR